MHPHLKFLIELQAVDLRLIEIRESAEKALGKKFSLMRFHDFILSQGLLPPSLLRKAVMEDFVVKEKGAH